MLEIVLLILKIAGIILAAVLGILIVALICVLFVPVWYRGDFSLSGAQEGEKKEISAVFRASWLLRLVRVYAAYEDAPRVRLKLLFFTLLDTAKENRAKRDKGEKSRYEEETRDAALAEEKVPAEPGGERKSGNKEKETAADTAETEASDKQSAEQKGKESAKESSKREKRTIKSRIFNLLQTIRNFCDKLRRMKEKTEEVKKLWNSGHMRRSRSLAGEKFLYLLKHTKPRKLSGYLRFGFDDPSVTGYIMAVYGILYPIWNPKLSVEPDFEKEVLDCHVLLKGKIRVWHFVRVALRMLLSKDVRRVIKDVRNFK